MLEIPIPGGETLRLEYLVADYNGTLARDGALLPGVAAGLQALAGTLTLHVITADTFGRARAALAGLPCILTILPPAIPPPGGQDRAKGDFIAGLGAERCVALGNGRNDRLMLRAAALGIAVLEGEGLAVDALLAADLVAPDSATALALLAHPKRLIATLRV